MQEKEPFLVPDKLIEKIFEISGGAGNKNKGLILAVCNEDGDPVIYSKFEEPIVQLGLTHALLNYINGNNNQIIDDL